MGRLVGLAFICTIIMMVALFLAARDGDVLSIVILSVLSALLLVIIGGCFVLFAGAMWARSHQSQSASLGEMANAQRALAGAMGAWGRTSQYAPPYPMQQPVIPAFPENQNAMGGAGLLMPQITTYRALAQDEAEDDGR